MVLSTVNHFTPEKYWSGVFHLPVDEPICIKSWFGNRRSYNGSPFTYFHTGVDYGVCASLNIYSPAAGVVFCGYAHGSRKRYIHRPWKWCLQWNLSSKVHRCKCWRPCRSGPVNWGNWRHRARNWTSPALGNVG